MRGIGLKSTSNAGVPEDSIPPRSNRPVPVTLVALFQFFKAGFLALIFCRAWQAHVSWAASGQSGDDPLAQQITADPSILVLPLMVIVYIVFGLGLWKLQSWARKNLVVMILLCWFNGGLSFNGFLFGKSIWMNEWNRQTLVAVFLLDLLVFCCLVYYPDVKKAFAEHD